MKFYFYISLLKKKLSVDNLFQYIRTYIFEFSDSKKKYKNQTGKKNDDDCL